MAVCPHPTSAQPLRGEVDACPSRPRRNNTARECRSARPGRQAASKGGPQYKGFFDCLITIAKTEGGAPPPRAAPPLHARTLRAAAAA